MCGRDRNQERGRDGIGSALSERPLYEREKIADRHPFDLRRLGEAFRIRETTPVHLPSIRNPIHVFCLFCWSFPFGWVESYVI